MPEKSTPQQKQKNQQGKHKARKLANKQTDKQRNKGTTISFQRNPERFKKCEKQTSTQALGLCGEVSSDVEKSFSARLASKSRHTSIG